jgi:hypothetical protein
MFPLLGIALMRMHWDVMRLVLTEVMTETTAPAPTIVAMGTMWISVLSNIAADDESDYGIDSHDKSSSKWLVFDARDSLVNAPPELIGKRRGRPPKVDNMLHGLSDALTSRYLNVSSTNREAVGGC